MYITSTGSYWETAHSELPNLKNIVRETKGLNIRRISRFIQLALIGAARTTSGLPADSGIYLSSGRGDMEVTMNVLNDIYIDSQSPKPLSFINSVSNAACFYVGQYLNTSGSNQFITSRFLAMETVLYLAYHDLRSGKLNTALVGAVESAVAPLETHRQRLSLEADAAIAEASHWLQLQTTQPQQGALAEITELEALQDIEAVTGWLEKHDEPMSSRITLGQYLSDSDRATLLANTQTQQYICSKEVGYFDSRSGMDICDFLSAQTDAAPENTPIHLLHIGGDNNGRYMVLKISRLSGAQ